MSELNSLFKDLGLGDWAEQMDSVYQHSNVKEGTVVWRNATLLTRTLYGLSADDSSLGSDILSGVGQAALSDVLWCSFTDFKTDLPNQVYVEHLPALKMLAQKAGPDFPLLVIDSAGALRHERPMRLANIFEDLRRWLVDPRTPEVSVLLIDRYTDDESSDARRLMRQYCQLLK